MLKSQWQCVDCGMQFTWWSVAAAHADDFGHQIERAGLFGNSGAPRVETWPCLCLGEVNNCTECGGSGWCEFEKNLT